MKKENSSKLIFKILGIVLTVFGVGSLIFGFVDFFIAFNSQSFEGPKFFYMNFIGIFLIGIGILFINIGFRDEILKYRSKQVGKVINGVNEEVNKSFVDLSNKSSIICSKCKTPNSIDSKFCKKCGSSLVKTCPYCNCEINSDSLYCENCGMKLQSNKK